ncbi:PucR family transcriptional regulator [Microtetraspora malaysiensis]|uniref:PucR family transcriptional regulator n=1 Tax=Microtetraspora malaysiensis TaxID=161358 RepID=UPI003D8B2512
MGNNKLTVEDLVRFPALQLRVLAGERGLDRSVSWAHVSELEDPTPWLLGSEVIMTTGIGVPRGGARQRAYLHRLDDAGVAALALSAGLHVPPLHPAFFAAAEERGFPILEVPLAVPFIAVAQEVAAAVQEDARQRLGAQLQVFGALRWLAAERLDPAQLFRRLERLSGYDVYLSTPQGRPLLPGVPVPPDIASLPPSVDAPPTIPGGFAVPVNAPGGPAGFLVAFEREGARPAGLAVVQHIATVAALQVAMVRHERETLRRQGAETLAELLQDVLDPATARRRLTRMGMSPDQDVVLLVVRNVDEDAVVRALDEHPHLMLGLHPDLYVLAHDPAPLREIPGVAAGASRPLPPGSSLKVAQREARWAAARATESGQPLVLYGDDTTGRWLPEDPGVLAGLVEHVLGDALRYDAAHGSELIASVQTWMERDRRTDDAARALHIHPNTLSYRLRRFSALTGRDLTATGEFAEVWLAMRAAQQLGRIP